MVKIVVINGFAGAGKSSFVNACRRRAIGTYKTVFTEISMVDIAKNFCEAIGLWDGVTKTDAARKLLADIKTELDERYDASFRSLEVAIEKLNKNLPNQDALLFVHAREPKDIERIVRKYCAVTLFVSADLDKTTHGNAADDNVTNYQYDFYIFNTMDGYESLEKTAEGFLQNLKLL